MTSRTNRTKNNFHDRSTLLAHRAPLPERLRVARRRHVLISGGAGFIGANLANRFLASGQPVLLYDNLSRLGVEQNVRWLQAEYGDLVRLEIADVRDAEALRQSVRGASRVFHFAAQTAVTTSLDDPIHDFEVNARGTLNMLEALRSLNDPPPLLLTSTNKVYGDLKDVELRMNLKGTRYEPVDADFKASGFSEAQPLAFHSPYGCSKGCACEYVLDYARTYQLPTVAFHMSCIYGPHQLGTEDQGWVAHFLIKALQNSPITIYGDGRQVRDILFVEDLVDAFLLAHRHIELVTGQAFNIGGGAHNTISLLELIDLIATLHGRQPEVRFAKWRSADQKYYVSDTRKFSEATGWCQKIGVQEGITRLYDWLRNSCAASALKARLDVPAANGNGNHHIGHIADEPRSLSRHSGHRSRNTKLSATNCK